MHQPLYNRLIGAILMLCLGWGMGVLLWPLPLVANPWHRQDDLVPRPAAVTILPELPQRNETVTVQVAGVWHDSCVPSYVSHTLADEIISITTSVPGPEVVCGQVFTPWGFDIELDTLTEEHYQVTVMGAERVTDTFIVLTHQIYLPLLSGSD